MRRELLLLNSLMTIPLRAKLHPDTANVQSNSAPRAHRLFLEPEGAKSYGVRLGMSRPRCTAGRAKARSSHAGTWVRLSKSTNSRAP